MYLYCYKWPSHKRKSLCIIHLHVFIIMLPVSSNLKSECQLSIDLQLKTITGSLSEMFFWIPKLGQWRMFIILQKRTKTSLGFFLKTYTFSGKTLYTSRLVGWSRDNCLRQIQKPVSKTYFILPQIRPHQAQNARYYLVSWKRLLKSRIQKIMLPVKALSYHIWLQMCDMYLPACLGLQRENAGAQLRVSTLLPFAYAKCVNLCVFILTRWFSSPLMNYNCRSKHVSEC